MTELKTLIKELFKELEEGERLTFILEKKNIYDDLEPTNPTTKLEITTNGNVGI